MSWRTSRTVLLLRSAGRKLGLNSYLATFINGREYEQAYDERFQSLIMAGDCIWDIGANVGYYTSQFAARVGAAGSVEAFEPSSINHRKLEATTRELTNVRRFEMGLGAQNGWLFFQQGKDDLGATSKVVDATTKGSTKIPIRTAASLIESGETSSPNVMKIDVEGFELEVLEGLGDRIRDTSLRLLGIEVHFGILKERGLPNAPKKIENLLNGSGFKVLWPDNSHIIAVRPGK